MKSMCVVSAVLLVCGFTANGADWPRFLGPKANGCAPDKGINKNWGQKPPKVLWKSAMYDRPERFRGYAGPAVAGGNVFIMDHKGAQDILRAIDLKKGEKVWETAFEVGSAPALCTPLHDGGRLYVVSAVGMVSCVSADKGASVWAVDLVKEYGSVPPEWKHAWSAVTDGDALLLTAGGPDATVVALDKATGKFLWKGGQTDGAGYAPVVAATVAGKKIYILSAQTTIQAVDSKGAVLWTFPWVNQWKVNAATPIVSDDMVFVTSGYGKGCALLDGKTGKPAWQNTLVVSQMSTPILAGKHIYTTSDPGKLVCMEFLTGNVKWEKPGFEKGGLCAVDGTLIVLDGARGDIIQVAIDPSGYSELGRMPAPLGGQSWTAPIVADGCLIFRNKQQLACIDLM